MSGKRYKRFYVSESENQLTIYDNEGSDDYYHLGNDERDVKGISQLLNSLVDDNLQLKKLLQEAEEENDRLKKSNKQWMESLVNMESED